MVVFLLDLRRSHNEMVTINLFSDIDLRYCRSYRDKRFSNQQRAFQYT